MVALADLWDREHRLGPWHLGRILAGATTVTDRERRRRGASGRAPRRVAGAAGAAIGLQLRNHRGSLRRPQEPRPSGCECDRHDLSTRRSPSTPYDQRIEDRLRSYVDRRLAIHEATETEQARRLADEVRRALWEDAAEVGRQHPDSPIVGLFIASLNEMIDLHEARVAIVYYQHLPRPILWTLYLVAMLAMMVLGYGGGLTRCRTAVPALCLILAISSVTVLIIAMDRPATHLFEVSQGAFEDLRAGMRTLAEQVARSSE